MNLLTYLPAVVLTNVGTEAGHLITVFLIGLCLGSFVNVCIWRIPRRKSIIYPSSRCPLCGAQLKWKDNLPLLSYLLLKGNCRYCGGKISLHYLFIELIAGIIIFLFYLKFGITIKFIFSVGLTVILLVASGIDWQKRIIPDRLTYPLMFLGLFSSFFNPFLSFPYFVFNLTPYTLHLTPFLYALCSLLFAGFFLYLIGLLGKKIFKKEAMGFGDVKFLAGIGSFLGIKSIFWVIFIASIFGVIFGISQILTQRVSKPTPTFSFKEATIPFAPYLSLGTLLVLFFST